MVPDAAGNKRNAMKGKSRLGKAASVSFARSNYLRASGARRQSLVELFPAFVHREIAPRWE